MFTKIFQKFAEKSPVTVMVHELLERLLNAERIDSLFNSVSEVQYTRRNIILINGFHNASGGMQQAMDALHKKTLSASYAGF